jgi:hypothetical protein
MSADKLAGLIQRRDALIAELFQIKAEIEAIEQQRYEAFFLHDVRARTMTVLRNTVFEDDDRLGPEPDLTDIQNARRIAAYGKWRFICAPNCGRGTIADIERYLKTHGLKLL